MSTRNGVPYQPSQIQPDLEAMVRTLTESMNKLSQDMTATVAQFRKQVHEDLTQLRDRVQVLEKRRHQNWIPDPKFNRPQPHPCQEPRRTLYRDPEHNLRKPNHDIYSVDRVYERSLQYSRPVTQQPKSSRSNHLYPHPCPSKVSTSLKPSVTQVPISQECWFCGERGHKSS